MCVQLNNKPVLRMETQACERTGGGGGGDYNGS